MFQDILKFLGAFGKGYVGKLVWLGIGSLVAALLEVVGIGLVFPLISVIVDPSIIENQSALQSVYYWLGMESPEQFVLVMGAVLAAIFVFKNLFMAAHLYWQKALMAEWKYHISTRLMARYLHAPYTLHLQRNSAEMIANVGSVVSRAVDGFAAQFILLMTYAIVGGAIFLLLIWPHPFITLTAGIVLAGLVYAQHRVIGTALRKLGKETSQVTVHRHRAMQQGLSSIKETRVLQRERFFWRQFAQWQQRFAHCEKWTQFLHQLPALLMEMAVILAVLGMVMGVVASADAPAEALSSLAMLAAAAIRLLPIVNRSMSALNLMQAARDPVYRLLEEANALPPVIKRPAIEDGAALPFNKVLVLQDVNYTYAGSEVPSLHNVNLTIARGEYIGLVGASGAGKSSLADVILGLLTPQSGRMLIDSKPVDAGTIGQWLSHVGYVPQSVYLTDDSLRRNVAFGIEDGDIDEGAVLRALEQAQLLELVRELPHGLDTMLGENGVRLSGGQRQRIGIARALYHDPDVLVLDEATSALDVDTEKSITEALHALKAEKTLIVIAHRFSTLKQCDRLVYLNKGKVIDTGDFDSLAKRNHAFKRMVELSHMEQAV